MTKMIFTERIENPMIEYDKNFEEEIENFVTELNPVHFGFYRRITVILDGKKIQLGFFLFSYNKSKVLINGFLFSKSS